MTYTNQIHHQHKPLFVSPADQVDIDDHFDWLSQCLDEEQADGGTIALVREMYALTQKPYYWEDGKMRTQVTSAIEEWLQKRGGMEKEI